MLNDIIQGQLCGSVRRKPLVEPHDKGGRKPLGGHIKKRSNSIKCCKFLSNLGLLYQKQDIIFFVYDGNCYKSRLKEGKKEKRLRKEIRSYSCKILPGVVPYLSPKHLTK
jgi:hypothetical protein